MSFDFEEIPKTPIIIGICVLVVAANFLLGGKDQLQQKIARDTNDNAGRDAQLRAESLFQEQGCIAQAISSTSRTSNFTLGDIAIDPISITPNNPAGTPINSGHLCSTDGSLFRVTGGQVAELIGTSPRIRKWLVDQGFAENAVEMQRRANQLYGGQTP